MVNNLDFTKRLEKILDYYALSAAAFAEQIDFNRSTISHLLSGRNKPSLEFVMKLLQKFPEVEMNWLLYGKGSFPASTGKSEDLQVTKQKSTIDTSKSLDLFSEETKVPQQNNITADKNSFEIEQIIIFYKNGAFKVYKN